MRTLGLAILLVSAACALSAPASGSTVFAAVSLTEALEEIGALYRRESGDPVRFSFAASSSLARQIELGARADIFVSADEAWMDYLVARRLVLAATRTSNLSNRLVLVAPRDLARPMAMVPRLALAERLGRDWLAIGDPAHVPAGRYARAALNSLGVWLELAHRLAPADSVRMALALVQRGEAPLGIVYASDAAAAPGVAVIGIFPTESHPRIRYPMAIVAGHDGPAARALLAFLDGPAPIGIYRKHGFIIED
ncbi:MAG: molybdate ABC transporter substrate-binding protein [Alphaproteobacteria bacterium]|nr:molybdate ABC transporter substrate-binding protein [Alphaproteobacteria bacterium]